MEMLGQNPSYHQIASLKFFVCCQTSAANRPRIPAV